MGPYTKVLPKKSNQTLNAHEGSVAQINILYRMNVFTGAANLFSQNLTI